MPEISRNTIVFQHPGVLSNTVITSFEPIYRTLKLIPDAPLSFSIKVGQESGLLSFDYFIFPFEGTGSFLKIDNFALTSHELRVAPFSGLIEFVLKEFKTRSGYIKRGPGIDSDYFSSNIERTVFIDKYSVFLKLPTEFDFFKSGGVSSNFTIGKWDDDPDSIKATKKTASVTIQQLDLTPFDVIELSPNNRAVLVPNDAVISFLLSDDLSGILLGELNIYINSEQVMTNGVVTATSGDLSFDIETPPYNNIRFSYTKDTPYEYGSTVNVIINGKDLATPLANITDFDYSFRIGNIADLSGYINCIPDTTPPHLENISPASGLNLANPCIPISFDVQDDSTGVNLDSLFVSVNGNTIVSDGILNVDSSFVTFTPIDRGYNFSYWTDSCFDWGTEYNVVVSGIDNYKISPNGFYTEYSFTTVDNSTIEIENFFIEELEVTMGVGPDSEITVDVLDSTYGIDISETKMYVDGEEVVFSYDIIANGYRLHYQPANLFVQSSFIDVLIHAVNLRGLSFPVFKEKAYKLSPGYRVEVLREKKYDYGYSKDVITTVFADNVGRNPESITNTFKFQTHDISSKDLYGYILSNLDAKYLYGTIQPIAPLFYYNKLINVRVEASDLEGNAMVPYEFSFRIQHKPE